MVINPIFILSATYFFANFYAFLNAIEKSGFEVYGYFYNVTEWDLVFVFALQSFFLFGLLVFFKINFRGYKYTCDEVGDHFGYFLLILTITFFLFNWYYGAGLAGSDFKFENENFLNYFFVLLKPDVWFFLIAPYLRSKKIFWICAAAFLVSLISRGWMGGVMLIGVVFFIRNYPVRISTNKIILLIVIFFIIVALLPVFDAFKWGMRSGRSVDEIFDFFVGINYFEVFPVVFRSVIERFQNFNYAVYALQERGSLLDGVLYADVNWFFQGGILNDIYCKLAGCGKDIGVYLAGSISGLSDVAWNVDIGISGWVVVLGWGFFAYVIFSFFLLNFGYRIFGSNFGFRGTMVFGAFSFIYFFHGWNNAFFNLIIYALIFQLLMRVKFTKSSESNLKLQ